MHAPELGLEPLVRREKGARRDRVKRMLVEGFLRRLVRKGELRVIDAGGRSYEFKGQEPLTRATIRFTDRRIEREMLLNPGLAVPEAYVDGRLIVEEGDLRDFLEICSVNTSIGLPLSGYSFSGPLRRLLRRLYQFHPPQRSKANVAHHYDLSGALYELFLDSERQYTCAYFPTGKEDIEEAQRAKERHIAAKLLLRPGQKVLDMGCGWGSLALHLAGEHQVDVTGVTLSEEQVRWGNERMRARGLGDRARLLLQDYRAATGRFDRIVSIGMLEHVGINHYGTLFRQIRDLLPDDGVALVHSIGRRDGPHINHPWLTKWIFPGSYAPALSEVIPAIERQGLWITDLEILRLHYTQTLKRWREKFLANWDKAKAIYDERFCRMWDVYLVGTELFFTHQGGFIFQIQVTKEQTAVPLTRDYIYEAEHGLPLAHARAAE
jgi:cyclopropane-fatty-acyl-phospholipid synthase